MEYSKFLIIEILWQEIVKRKMQQTPANIKIIDKAIAVRKFVLIVPTKIDTSEKNENDGGTPILKIQNINQNIPNEGIMYKIPLTNNMLRE